jgi:CheY-like chemotaxis protein
MTSPLFAERRHQISLEVTCGSVHVIGDRRRLVQAVMNLLTNAAKYMEEGGHVDVRALRDEESVVIRVRDAGFGIPADLMPRLFEPLVPARASSDRRSRGHGLGLLIARQIVELHGGTVTAASDGLGKGTEVVIRLPAVEGMPPRPGVVSPPESARAAQRPLRVLVVDPSADGADVLADYLGWLGHGTAVAVDAYDALEIAERFRPDVAMIDFGLPGMDGFELARLLRERAERLTLVAVTGRDQAPDHEATRGAGFHAHLVKPIDASVVAPLLDALMGR